MHAELPSKPASRRSLLGFQRSEYFRRTAYGDAPYLLWNIAMNALTLS